MNIYLKENSCLKDTFKDAFKKTTIIRYLLDVYYCLIEKGYIILKIHWTYFFKINLKDIFKDVLKKISIVRCLLDILLLSY